MFWLRLGRLPINVWWVGSITAASRRLGTVGKVMVRAHAGSSSSSGSKLPPLFAELTAGWTHKFQHLGSSILQFAERKLSRHPHQHRRQLFSPSRSGRRLSCPFFRRYLLPTYLTFLSHLPRYPSNQRRSHNSAHIPTFLDHRTDEATVVPARANKKRGRTETTRRPSVTRHDTTRPNPGPKVAGEKKEDEEKKPTPSEQTTPTRRTPKPTKKRWTPSARRCSPCCSP